MLITTLANKKYMIVEVCTHAVQVEVPYLSSTASAVTESGTFLWGCKGGNRTACTYGCKECQGIGATGNVRQVLRTHRGTKEKAHCPGYLEQCIIRRTWRKALRGSEERRYQRGGKRGGAGSQRRGSIRAPGAGHRPGRRAAEPARCRGRLRGAGEGRAGVSGPAARGGRAPRHPGTPPGAGGGRHRVPPALGVLGTPAPGRAGVTLRHSLKNFPARGPRRLPRPGAAGPRPARPRCPRSAAAPSGRALPSPGREWCRQRGGVALHGCGGAGAARRRWQLRARWAPPPLSRRGSGRPPRWCGPWCAQPLLAAAPGRSGRGREGPSAAAPGTGRDGTGRRARGRSQPGPRGEPPLPDTRRPRCRGRRRPLPAAPPDTSAVAGGEAAPPPRCPRKGPAGGPRPGETKRWRVGLRSAPRAAPAVAVPLLPLAEAFLAT